MRRTCFKCLKDLDPVFASPIKDDIKNPPDNATHWITYGNYGSTIHDSNQYYLEIYICDECLVASQATIYKVKQRTIKDLEVEKWDKK